MIGATTLVVLSLFAVSHVNAVCSPEEEQAVSKCAQPLYSVLHMDASKFNAFKNNITYSRQARDTRPVQTRQVLNTYNGWDGYRGQSQQQPNNQYQQQNQFQYQNAYNQQPNQQQNAYRQQLNQQNAYYSYQQVQNDDAGDDKSLRDHIRTFAKVTKDYVSDVCQKYKDFEQCVQPYRANCIDVSEDARAQSAAVADGLQFVCGNDYNSAFKNFECFSSAMLDRTSWECHRVMAVGIREANKEAFEATTLASTAGRFNSQVRDADAIADAKSCSIMQDYLRCLKGPMNQDCGDGAWQIVKKVVANPAGAALKDCPLSGTSIVPHAIAVILTAILSISMFL